MPRNKTLFDDQRLSAADAVGMTVESINRYAASHRVWCVAWSGGKDSTALLTTVMHLLDAGRVSPPERLIVCYADTRMELPPLAWSAKLIIGQLRERGIEVRVVMSPLDKRFFVYMLGRGVPPPNNNTFRWCTRQIKVDPMYAELRRVVGEAAGDNVLMLTGVRQGESAIRDGRIAMSCGEWQTEMLADAYGGEEAEELNARTGCVGCPLANQDTALDAVLKLPHNGGTCGLSKRLRPIYRALREPHNRLRQPGGETRQDGTLAPNQHRMGPLTMEARRWALASILNIQERCNVNLRPPVDILNQEEVDRIIELIAANTWPNKWTGDEPRADEEYVEETGQLALFAG